VALDQSSLDALTERHLEKLRAAARKDAQARADLFNLHGVKPPAGQRAWRAADFLPDTKPRRSFADICAAYGVSAPKLPTT
jgi:hypothetical protein